MPIRAGADSTSAILSEVLPGETFDLLELSSAGAWGISTTDNVVGYIDADALGPYVVIATSEGGTDDVVANALALVGTPSRIGGRSALGLDAGGLIFLSLSQAGIVAPRFCDLQAQILGRTVGDAMRRGDLLFFGNHAAILTDAETVVHVGAKNVVVEPLEKLLTDGTHGPIAARRRLS